MPGRKPGVAGPNRGKPAKAIRILNTLLEMTEADRINTLATAIEYNDHPSFNPTLSGNPGAGHNRLEKLLDFAIDELIASKLGADD